MNGCLFVKSEKPPDLASFARVVRDLIKATAFERRESSNYFGGEYYIGAAPGVEATITLADDSEFSTYQYWIIISYENVSVAVCSDAPEDRLAKQLVLKGYDVVRALEFGKIGGGKVLYSLNPASDPEANSLKKQ